MKIWYGYGSEHSMRLVMIGHFKTVKAAKETHDTIEKLKEEFRGKVDIGSTNNRYSDEILSILQEVKCYSLGPQELEQFLYDYDNEIKGNKILIETNESDVSALLKLMINNGAKIEIFSRHDYPDSDN